MLMRMSALPPVRQELARAGKPKPLARGRIAGSEHGDGLTTSGTPQ